MTRDEAALVEAAASPDQKYLGRLRAWLEPERELAAIVEHWDAVREHREAACSRWQLVECVRALQATICARFPAPPVETGAEGIFLQLIHELSIDQSKLRPDQIKRWWRLQDQCADAIAKNQIERVYDDILDDIVRAVQTMAEYEEDIMAGMHGEQPGEEAEPVDKIEPAPDPAGFAAPDYEFDPMIDEFFYLQADKDMKAGVFGDQGDAAPAPDPNEEYNQWVARNRPPKTSPPPPQDDGDEQQDEDVDFDVEWIETAECKAASAERWRIDREEQRQRAERNAERAAKEEAAAVKGRLEFERQRVKDADAAREQPPAIMPIEQPKPQPQPANKEGHDQTSSDQHDDESDEGDRDDQADDAVWSNPWSKMGQAKQAKALRELHRMRMKAGKVDKPFRAWAADMKVDLTRVYDTDVLGKKVAFSVPEDEVFGSTRWCKPVTQMRKGRRVTLTAMAFPAMVPAGETKHECTRRREKFRRRQRRDAMQSEPQLQLHDAEPAPRVTRFQSLLNVLPAPPGRITIAAAAAKLRPRRSWRMPDGKMLMLASIERDIRRMCEHPDIGCEVRHDPNGHALPTRLLWRKPNGPRG